MNLPYWIACGGGTGRFPVAPGTFASAVAVGIGVLALRAGPAVLPVLVLLSIAGGIWAIGRLRDAGDAGWIVIDEFAGQWIAMLGIGTLNPVSVAAAFFMFRLLDIAKPGPVGWADRRHGPFWIMADDLVAGAIAAALLFASGRLFPALPS